MSFFDDAAAFMKERKTEATSDDDAREVLIRRLKSEYENATEREIRRALDLISEKEGTVVDFETVLKKIRVYLED